MLTENLQEMVSGVNTQHPTGMSSEYDILLHQSKSEEESSRRSELQVVEQSEPDIEIQQSYQPDEEAALISYINDLNLKLGKVTIVTHWKIGQTIYSFYQGKYGTNELGKISAATGIGHDTFVKACKLAKQYSKENLEMLLKGNFVMTWFQIAQHLTVEPQKVIDTYQQSPDQKQFNYDIIKLKNPSEARGKSKPPRIVEMKPAEEPVIVTPEIVPSGLVTPQFIEFEKPADTSENEKHYY